MRQLVVTLEKDPQMRTDPSAALTDAFVYTNRALMGQQMDYATSGTTCVTVYIQKEKIWVANVGDSRAVMACEDESGNYLAKGASVKYPCFSLQWGFLE
jgi:serine/threonine protein phosphatase PrpC